MPWEYRRSRWYENLPPMRTPEKILLVIGTLVLLALFVMRAMRAT